MSKVFCHECGVNSSGTSKFCGNCGTELDLSILSSSKVTHPKETQQTPKMSQGFQLNQQGFQPSQQGYQPSQQGFQPNQQGFQPSQQGFQPNQQGFQLNQQGYQPSNKYLQPNNQFGYQPGLNKQAYDTQNKINNLLLLLKIRRGLTIFILTIFTLLALVTVGIVGLVFVIIIVVAFLIQTWFINGVISRNNTTRIVLLVLNGIGVLSGLLTLPGSIISLAMSGFIVYVLMDQSVKMEFQNQSMYQQP